MKSSSPETEEEKNKTYIPVYKKGFRSKTFHSKNHSNPFSHATSSKGKHRKTSVSNKSYHKKVSKHYDKVLVFDLDETLGSFSELQWIWNAMLKQHLSLGKKIHSQPLLKTLIDIYPEFLRPGILHILEFVARRKKQGDCMAVFVYTNNQQPPPWTEIIVEYFNQYIETKYSLSSFFDQTIQAFKIGQEKIEWMRTSHDKSYDDFIKCTVLPTNTEICFIDNTYYHSMTHPKVYYIQPKSYQHSLTPTDIIQRFLLAETSGILDEYFPTAQSFLFFTRSSSQKNIRKIQVKQFIERTMNEFSKNKESRIQNYSTKQSPTSTKNSNDVHNQPHHFENIDIDLYVSNKLMDFIREFFILTTYSHIYTRKNIHDKPTAPTASTVVALLSPTIPVTDSKITASP